WDLLDKNETAALENLYRAGVVMDELFLRQVWKGNVELRKALNSRDKMKELKFFNINFGPWDRINENEPFIGKILKPDGAEFYPTDMTKQEFEDWIAAHPADREAFEGTFTVIRRGEKPGQLVAIPYSTEHKKLLDEAAGYMRLAADQTASESLAKFLRSRADAFASNDYFQSDMDWMDVRDNLIDVTIGPYEVYEDNLFNYKAAFEAFVCIRDPKESVRLDGLKGYLVKMENNLPIPDEHKNLNRGSESPISVVDVVYTGGDTKAGVQTLAFNLPNDERVQEAKGSKKVMLRNIIHAKFDKILMPIAKHLIADDQLKHVTFDAYYNHILLHEFSHGLGPGRITLADGTETTAQKALKETHSSIEEAKADIVGEYNIYYLIKEGFFDRELEKDVAVTFLAGFFRSVRFGAESAHGRANMIIFNYMRENGAYSYDTGSGKWSVDTEKMHGAVKDLSAKILMIQALGDYEAAKGLLDKYGIMDADVEASLLKLRKARLPVDIVPQFEIQKKYATN
ncbi:MAG: peptidase, partial [Candidatus Krumholzibacteria bacterium]|nr:peptidase [Candidatus Krumholzibacteria bacterium]